MITAAFLGDKAAALQQGEEIQLVNPDGQELIYAELLDIWIGPLSNVPAILLEKAHDPLQRNFTGLHLHLLSRLGFLLKDSEFKRQIAKQSPRGEIFGAVRRLESEL